MSKIKLGRYYDKTPVRVRKIADSILYGLGAVGTLGLLTFEDLKTIFTESQIRWGVGIVLFVAFLCKFISNFAKEDNSEENTNINKNKQDGLL
jgi:hypothetical protein